MEPCSGAVETRSPLSPPPGRWCSQRTQSSSWAATKSSRSKPLESWAGPGGGLWPCSALTPTAAPSNGVLAAGVASLGPGGQHLGQGMSIKPSPGSRLCVQWLTESLGEALPVGGHGREELETDSGVSSPGLSPSSGSHCFDRGQAPSLCAESSSVKWGRAVSGMYQPPWAPNKWHSRGNCHGGCSLRHHTTPFPLSLVFAGWSLCRNIPALLIFMGALLNPQSQALLL